MIYNDRMLFQRLSPVVAIVFALLCACVPLRVVEVDPPRATNTQNLYAGEDIYLRRFAVLGASKNEELRRIEVLRSQFASYLKIQGKYRNVVDLLPGSPEPADDALVMDVELEVQVENTILQDSIFGINFLYIITPRSGHPRVSGNASIYRNKRNVNIKSWTATGSYSYVLFGAFRTSPIEKAIQTAYEEVFARIVVPLQPEGSTGISAAEIKSMVQEGIAAGGKQEKKVYHSDVDTPAYKVPESDPDNFAVVIGIEKYSGLPQADFGERDAQVVKDHLLALGYPPRNIVHLSGNLASRANIEKYIEYWLPEKIGARSRIFVYFSGHGAPDVSSGQSYIVPWDGDTKFLKNTGYPLRRFYEKLDALKAKSVLVVLDSCFSGGGGRSVLPAGSRPLITKLDQGVSSMGRLTVLAASQGDEIAGVEEAQGHGLFTYHLLRRLNESKGQATVKDLYDYLVPRVQDGARQANRDQTPQLISGELGQAGKLVLGKP